MGRRDGGEQASNREAIQRSAVSVSFWVGGLALVALKGFAYFLSGSTLVRAAMFESVGDVLSSRIMAVTQARVADTRDHDNYPRGKRRLTPIGVLFFAAFAMSTMVGLAIESLQAVLSPGEEPAEVTPEAELRLLFHEKPRLRYLIQPGRNIEGLIAEYSGIRAELEGGKEDLAASDSSSIVTILLVGCIVTKLFCLVWCSGAAKRANSEIARALAADHRNDVISNSTVVVVMFLVSWAKGHGYEPAWIGKVDPTASFLLSVWIAYGWMSMALEQVTLLSNRRVEPEVAETVADVARKHLEAGHLLELCDVHVYHAGEGCAADLAVKLRSKDSSTNSCKAVAEAIETLETCVLEADCDVSEVHARLCSSRPGAASAACAGTEGADAAWVSQYSSIGSR